MNTIQHLLYDSFMSHADRNAVLDPEDGSVLTYAQLYRKAAAAAGYLQDKGLVPGDFTVIALPKSVSYIIAETACLLFGFGAVLMDAAYPPERVAYAARDAGAKLVIDARVLQEMLAWPRAAEYREVPEDTPAVVVYTSGSTGKPKGILHDQESLYNSIRRRQTILHPSPEDLAGLIPPFTFIAGCVTTMNPLCSGACVTVIPREVIVNPLALADHIDRLGITWTYMSPKILKVFQEKGTSLRMVTTGSERVSGIGPRRYQIYNTYGMSETCSAVAGFLIDKPYDNTPLGHALGDYAIYLLDERCNRVPEGEICIAGHLLTRYIGLPELTAKAIIPNPFAAEDGHPTLFRTGDLGRFDEQGRLVFVNRMDWMVKINGQRVEPGEIEAVLKSVPGVTDAAVKGFTRENGQTYLCAYYVAEKEVGEDVLRAAVSRRLPAYMMPAHFILLEAMPVNANGKLNRLALEEPETARFAAEYAAPATPLEERLCAAMAEVLEIPRVGARDDFFRLGGDSVSCMSLLVKLDEPDLSVRMLYRHRTPEAIAAALTAVRAMAETEDEAEASRLARAQDQPLIPYQLYYLDYQLYTPGRNTTSIPYVCSAPRELLDPRALKQAVDRVTRHFAVFGTVFLFNNAFELVQRYCPDRIPEVEVVERSEAAFHAEEKKAFSRPFRMLNSLLWRGRIVVTETSVHLLMNFDHAIADGTMIRLFFRQVFEALRGRELPRDDYYLYLHRMAARAGTPEARADHELVRGLCAGNWSRFPVPDRDSRDNTSLSFTLPSKHTSREYQAAAAAAGISLGTALVTAGLMSLSRYNGERKVAVEWVYNGRDEAWKENLVGLTLCGIPAMMDFGSCVTRDRILAEARRQNELGLQYAELSFALENMSPARNEYMKVVYEHGLTRPDNIPEGVSLAWDSSFYSSLLCLFQFIINEGTEDEPLSVIAECQGSRYREDSLRRMAALFTGALDELLFP